MIGYKAIELRNGTLRGSHDFLFELEVTSTQSKRVREMTDFQDCYFHYCENIEDVLFWSNYFSISDSVAWRQFRLFEITASDDFFNNCDKDWVTNNITINREICQDEIIEYFNSSKSLTDLADKYNFENYKVTKVEPHRISNDKGNILNDYIDCSCGYRTNENCKQDGKTVTSISNCKLCKFYNYIMGAGSYIFDYYYTILRSIIINGNKVDTHEYYQLFWVDNKHSQELSVIDALQDKYVRKH